ncbi:DsbA family oxidoreductase [Gracilibacillus dipsosauri]|uniref:DsbA family oxidoreductase n=1 Tax=Gracilibacillus dipsosauri TaxID=178340 RepID=UPI002408FA89
MEIEIWSDFSCPFCYIGKMRLEKAVERYPKKLDILIKYKSFQLDPEAPKTTDKSIHEILAKKYNMTVERAKQMNQQLVDQAKGVGLHFHMDTLQATNTFTAHRVTKFAHAEGKEEQFVNNMFQHYFTHSSNLSDPEILLQVCKELSLDLEKVKQIIESSQFEQDVLEDIEEAKNLGITGVPFFVFNQKYAISGAQPVETFMQALERITEEENSNLKDLTPNKKRSFCEGDQCKF